MVAGAELIKLLCNLLFLLAARQSVQAPSALAPQRRFEPTVLALPVMKTKKEDKSCDLSSMVGHRIEISNSFLKDFEVVILFVEWIDEKVPNYR